MKYLKVIDDRLQSTESTVNIVKGGTVTYKSYNPSGLVNNTSCQFTLDTTDSYTGRMQRILVNMKGEITITGTGLDADNGPKAGFIGFKPFPCNRVCSSVSHKIGNAIVTSQNSLLMDFLANTDFMASQYLDNPNFIPDEFASYNSVATLPCSPFANYSQSLGNAYKPRNVGLTLKDSSATSAVYSYDIYEPLLTGLSNLKDIDAPAIYNIPSESIRLDFANNLLDMIGIAPGCLPTDATITNVSNKLSGCDLYCSYINSNIPSDETASYFFPAYEISNTSGGTIAPGGTTTKNKVNQQLTSVPQRLFLFERQDPSARSVAAFASPTVASTPADRFCAIANASVSFGTYPPMLNAASPKQLYDISVKNGYTGTYECWAQLKLADLGSSDVISSNIFGAGSVLVLDPATDLGINAFGLTNNSACNANLTATVNVYNYQTLGTGTQTAPTFADSQLTMVCELVYELIRANGDYVARPLVLPVDETRKITDDNSTEHDMLLSDANPARKGGKMLGGSFWGDFANGFKKPFEWAWKHKNEIADGAKLAAKVVGLGMKENKQAKPNKSDKLRFYN
jgi:hypothetical protein